MTLRRPTAMALAAMALAAVPLAAAEPRATDAPAAFSAMAEDLQRLQTQIAQGDKSAYPGELAELKAMAAAIGTAKPETWAAKREADALIVYVLSGGPLAPIAPLLKGDALAVPERALARGVLAYVTSHEADALEALGPVDLEAVDVELAGPLAFARSVLRTRRDPKGAVADLDRARLVAPGGLVEEAALRREAALLAEAGDARRVAMLIRQYATRFAASLYAPDFFRDLARSIARSGLADDPANYRLLSDAAAGLPADARRDFLLALARAAALNGRFDAAAAAADEVLRSAAPGSAEEARARLYLGAGRIFSDRYDAAVEDLRAIAPSRLDRSDAALLSAARGVAAQLRAPPAEGSATADGAAEARTATISRAEEALRRTESLAAAGGSRGP